MNWPLTIKLTVIYLEITKHSKGVILIKSTPKRFEIPLHAIL